MSILRNKPKWLALFILAPMLSACVDAGPGPGYPPERPAPGWSRPDRPDPRPDWDRPSRPDRPDRPSRPDRPDWDRPSRPDRPGRPDRPENGGGMCTREYRPVCGQRGGRLQTFPNACEARNAGFGAVSPGECCR